MVQFTDDMKLKKKGYHSVCALILLGRGNRIIMGDRGWEELVMNRERGVRGHLAHRGAKMGDRKLGIATRKYQMPGKQEACSTQWR